MAHIKQFAIQRLAGRETPYVKSLLRSVNVFFGLNGTGKTSLLKILHSALSGDAALLQSVPFTSATVEIEDRGATYTRTFTKPYSDKPRPQGYRPTLGSIGSPEAIDAIVMESDDWVWRTTPEHKLRGQGWPHTYLSTLRLFEGAQQENYYVTRSSQERLVEQQIDRRFQQLLETLWSRYTSIVLRRMRNAQEIGMAGLLTSILAVPQQQSQGTVDPAEVELAFTRVKQFLGRQARLHGPIATFGNSYDDFRQRYLTESAFRIVVDHLNNVEQQIERAGNPRTRLSTLLNRLFQNKKVNLEDEGISIVGMDNSSIPLALLSSGEKHVLRLFVETVNAGSNPVLIDEPEISLHVDWQHDLVPALRELAPGSQLILATHSPEVLSGLDDQEIHRL